MCSDLQLHQGLPSKPSVVTYQPPFLHELAFHKTPHLGFLSTFQSFGERENSNLSYLYKLPLNEKLFGLCWALSPGAESSMKAMINEL